jgi:hypothetical protein
MHRFATSPIEIAERMSVAIPTIVKTSPLPPLPFERHDMTDPRTWTGCVFIGMSLDGFIARW